MSLPITIGNWTLDTYHVRPVQTLKSISIADARSSEFTASITPPDKQAEIDTDQSLYYTDQTGLGMFPAGTMSVGRSRVKNIYSSNDTPATARLPQTDGVRVYLQRVIRFHATNNVSGQEYDFPVRQSYSIVVPAWSAVPQDVAINAIQEFIGDLYAGASVTTPQTVIDAIRGDIDLTR